VAVLPDGAVLTLTGKSHSGRSSLADVWRSDDSGASWYELPTPPWPPRRQASVAVLPDGQVLLLAGGSADGRLGDAWRSDDGGKSWRQLQTPPWPARWQACAVALHDGSVLLLAGESDGDGEGVQSSSGTADSSCLADVWRSYDGGETWQQLPTPPWPARRQASAGVLADGSVLLVGGWLGSEHSYFDDAWRSDDGGVSWSRLPPPPWPPRYGACMITQTDDSVVVMGGESYGVFLADVWRSSDRCRTWRQLPKPPWPPRVGAAGVSLPSGAALVLTGHGDDKFLGDVWQSGTGWEGDHTPEMEDTNREDMTRMLMASGSPRKSKAQAESMELEEEEDGGLASALEPHLGADDSGTVEGDYSRSAAKYEVGDAVEFLNTAHQLWIPASVTDVDSCKRIMLDVKAGIWLSVDDQGSLVRPSPFSTRPGQTKLGLPGQDGAAARSAADMAAALRQTGGHDKEGRWRAAPQRWVERYVDALSPEMQVSPRAHKFSRRPE